MSYNTTPQCTVCPVTCASNDDDLILHSASHTGLNNQVIKTKSLQTNSEHFPNSAPVISPAKPLVPLVTNSPIPNIMGHPQIQEKQIISLIKCPNCCAFFASKEEYVSHLKMHINSSTMLIKTDHSNRDPKMESKQKITLFKCEHCSDLFVSNNEYNQHRLKMHLICEQKITSVENIPSHNHMDPKIETKQKITLFKCEHCSDFFASNNEYNQHKLKMHPTICDQKMTSVENFKSGVTEHGVSLLSPLNNSIIPLKEQCPSAIEVAATESKDSTQQTLGIKCNVCGIKYENTLDYTNHLSEHSSISNATKPVPHRKLGNASFKCPHCSLVCVSQHGLTNHLRIKHEIGYDPDQLICCVCAKAFPSPWYLKDHLKSHSTERPFRCQLCPKAYKRKKNLTRHNLAHAEGRKKIKCALCEERFPTRCELKIHKKEYHADKVYPCSVCTATFTKKAGLKAHEFTHLRLRPFACDLCNKTYASSFAMKTHRLTHSRKSHTGKSSRKRGRKRAHQCTTCSKIFLSNKRLKRHKTKEHPEQYVKCDLCPALFTSQNWMKKHRNIHSGNHR